MEPIPNRFVKSLFEAFSGRSLPVADAYWGNDEAAAVEWHFKGVLPRQVSFEFVESCFDADFILSAMKPLTQLYYAPSFMALCVEDYERVNLEPDQILHWFRFWPFETSRTHDGDNLGSFRLSSQRYTADELKHLRKWYFEGFRPEENVHIAASTEREKLAFVSFFEFLESHRPLEYSLDGWHPDAGRSLYAAKALLRGESLPGRLGAVSKLERQSLLGTLDTLESDYPQAFPRSATRPIIDALGRYA